jgi:hypothetical protein
VQSKLPIDNILIHTSLASSDEHKRLETLVPIREYMQKIQPPGDHIIQPLLKHLQELLEFLAEYQGNETSSSTVTRVSSIYSNIQNVLQNGLQQGHADLVNSIYCACCLIDLVKSLKLALTALLVSARRANCLCSATLFCPNFCFGISTSRHRFRSCVQTCG